jgi:hypothetical protein
VFLPENSTHMLQPLDVSVFAPMKKKWRQVLAEWKEECVAKGINYATIPKTVKIYHTLPTVLYPTWLSYRSYL